MFRFAIQRAAGNDCTSICEPRCTITVCEPAGLGELDFGGNTNFGSAGGATMGNAAANCGITTTSCGSSGSIQPTPVPQAKRLPKKTVTTAESMVAIETVASSVSALARLGVNGNECHSHENAGGEKLPHLSPRHPGLAGMTWLKHTTVR